MTIRPINIFRASTGLNVKVDPTRILFDPETGVTDLAVAYNIVHDRTGRPSRRKGYTEVRSEAFTSLFYGGTDVIGVTGTSLCVLSKDLTQYSAIGTVTQDAPLDCVQVADAVYWVNGHEKGFVYAGENNEWVMPDDYYGVDTKKELVGPPLGELIAVHGGQVYIADGPSLYVSDPGSLNHFDSVRGDIPWEANITMLKSVLAGLFVGTNRGCWFLAVSSPEDFRLVKLNDSIVIKGTAVKYDIGMTSFGRSLNETGIGVIWTATDGIYLGTADGRAYNITDQKLYPLNALSGTAQIINGNYIVSLTGDF